MSTHFSISLGLLIACGVHVFIFFKYELNQNVIILKKEQVLHIILNKAPEKKTALETPVIQENVENVKKIEKPIQKPIEPSKKTKSKKTNKKQQVKNKIQKKEEIKQIESQKNESPQQNNNVEQFETPQETESVISEEKPQEIVSPSRIKKTEKKIQTIIDCESYSYCPKPQYPFVAKQRGIEGRVKLALTVDENGAVIDAKIIESEPEDMFEEAAFEAVMQYRNLPKQLFNSTVERTIKFELK